MKILSSLLVFIFVLFFKCSLQGQTYTDGPMRLVIRVNYGWICCYNDAGFGAAENRWKFWARDYGDWDGLDWRGGTCIGVDTWSTGWIGGPWGDSFWLMDAWYGTNVPVGFDLYIDAWEEDGCGGDCDYNTGWYCDNDDAHCGGGQFAWNIDYRSMGPPCQWNNPGVGQDVFACGAYGGEFNSYWQYTENPGVGTYIWRGKYSYNWNDACNWNTSTVPNSAKDVIIPAGYTYYPIIYNGVSAYCNTIEVQSTSGAYLEIQAGGTLTVTQ